MNLAVYTDGKEVYLVRKTERYWKGLWTLPELCEEDAEKPEAVLPVVEHRLTHLLLKIYPVRLPMPEEVPAEWRVLRRSKSRGKRFRRRFENSYWKFSNLWMRRRPKYGGGR